MVQSIKGILILCFITTFLHANTEKNYTKAMELSLKQVAIIPSIMKNYVMAEMHQTFGSPKTCIQNEIEDFKKLQKKMAQLPLDPDTEKSIKAHTKMWQILETLLSKPISKKRFKELKKLTVPLRNSIRKIIRVSKKRVGSKLGSAIYYAGKLSAASQKFASLYVLLNWGMNNKKLQDDLKRQKALYADTLVSLAKTPLINHNEKEILKNLEKEFQYFSYLEHSTKTFKPALVYRKTKMMSQKSDIIMERLLSNN